MEFDHTLYMGAPGYNFLVEKWNFCYDVCFKSKKFQIAQIFRLSFRSLKNLEAARILLFDIGNKFIGSLYCLIHIFYQTSNLSFQCGEFRPQRTDGLGIEIVFEE